MMKKIIIIASLVLVLSGCVRVVKQPLSADLHKKITHSTVLETTPQHTITVDKPNYSGLGAKFGLIGSIVATIRQHHANAVLNKDIGPIRDEIVNVNFLALFKKHLNNELKHVSWLHMRGIQMRYSLNTKQEKMIARNSKVPFNFVVDATYAFTKNFRLLHIGVNVKLYTNDPKLIAQLVSVKSRRPLPKLYKLYNNDFVFLYTPKGSNRHKAHNLMVWKQDNAEEVRTALEEGVKNVAKMITIDIKDSSPVNTKDTPRTKKYHFAVPVALDDFMLYGPSIKGELVYKTPGGIVLKYYDGRLLFLSKGVYK